MPPTDTPKHLSSPALLSGTGTWRELIRPLDEGNFDVAGFLKSIDAVGYKGAIGLQCFHVRGAPEDHLKRSITRWEEIRGQISRAAKP